MNNELGLSKKLIKEFEDKMFSSKNMDEFKDFIVRYFRSHKGLKITMSKERLKELEKPEQLVGWSMDDIVTMALLNSRLRKRVLEN